MKGLSVLIENSAFTKDLDLKSCLPPQQRSFKKWQLLSAGIFWSHTLSAWNILVNLRGFEVQAIAISVSLAPWWLALQEVQKDTEK